MPREKQLETSMTLVRALWVMMALLILAGVLALSMWGIPAPSTRIEKVISIEKLPQKNA